MNCKLGYLKELLNQIFKGALQPKLKGTLKPKFKKELYNRNLKGTFKSDM